MLQLNHKWMWILDQHFSWICLNQQLFVSRFMKMKLFNIYQTTIALPIGVPIHLNKMCWRQKYHSTKMKFSIKDFFSKCDLQQIVNLVTFNEEILNRKLHFLCGDNRTITQAEGTSHREVYFFLVKSLRGTDECFFIKKR